MWQRWWAGFCVTSTVCYTLIDLACITTATIVAGRNFFSNKVTWTFCRLDLCLEISVKFSINPTFCCAWSLFLLILFPLQMVFVCHFFCLPLLFLSLCSSFEFNEPKILISERTTHHGFYSSFKIISGSLCEEGRRRKKTLCSPTMGFVLFIFEVSPSQPLPLHII